MESISFVPDDDEEIEDAWLDSESHEHNDNDLDRRIELQVCTRRLVEKSIPVEYYSSTCLFQVMMMKILLYAIMCLLVMIGVCWRRYHPSISALGRISRVAVK